MNDRPITPTQEYAFLLHDVLAIHRRQDLHGFVDLDPELTEQILTGVLAFSVDVLQPLNAIGDREGCALENGVVRTPPGFADAYRDFCEAGWNRLGAPEQFGGMELPGVVGMAVAEIVSAHNSAFSLYPALTRGAMLSVARAGDDWMREHVVPRMVSGDWAGTMCLTEPHCGTDLKLMSTRATPLPDGSYRIDGTKIFISGGDQDLTENIVHLVLAKLPDAGGRYRDDLATVALFLVPKMAIDTDGSLSGKANGVGVGGVEHKMGLRGSATCVLNFEGAIGWRLGSTKRDAAEGSTSVGMSAMFDMMNHARLATGMQACATASAAYRMSSEYARERLAGRAPDPAQRTQGRADPIVVHPDVRRMLLSQASFLEGARAMALWVSLLLDEEHRLEDRDEGRMSGALASLLTPVAKAFMSDRATDSANQAVQIFGGHGYIRETGVEQIVRDCRIFQLYEGANGIQALDLASRKLSADSGSAFRDLTARIFGHIETGMGDPAMRKQADALRHAVRTAEDAAEHVLEMGRNLEEIGAASYEFLNIIGMLTIAYMWARMGSVAAAKLAVGEGDPSFMRRKILLGDYWAERELPRIDAALAALRAGAATLMALPNDAF